MSAAQALTPELNALDLAELEDAPGFLLQLALVSYVEDTSARMPADVPLRMAEYAILVAISENAGAQQGEIGELLHISRSHMTKMISRLELAGFVTRTVPSENRRALRLDLTDSGRAALAKMRRILPPIGKAVLTVLSNDEKDMLVALLRKVAGRPDRATTKQKASS